MYININDPTRNICTKIVPIFYSALLQEYQFLDTTIILWFYNDTRNFSTFFMDEKRIDKENLIKESLFEKRT